MGRLDETSEPGLLESVLAPVDTSPSELLFLKALLLERINTWRKTYGGLHILGEVQKLTTTLDEMEETGANLLLHTRTCLLQTVSDGRDTVDVYRRNGAILGKLARDLTKLLLEIEGFVDTLEEKVFAQRP